MMKSDVVIIGGGLAGLSTGALLAKQGKGVTVIEKGNQPGGRAYAYEEKGFTLNYGPHAMYLPESGERCRVPASSPLARRHRTARTWCRSAPRPSTTSSSRAMRAISRSTSR